MTNAVNTVSQNNLTSTTNQSINDMLNNPHLHAEREYSEFKTKVVNVAIQCTMLGIALYYTFKCFLSLVDHH